MTKFVCFICGYRTLDERCGWDICPVCFWEDDVLVEGDVDKRSPANHMTISEAQANYARIGAVSPEFLDNVRPPQKDEGRDPNWKPLSSVEHKL
jgi:hypothetical protein